MLFRSGLMQGLKCVPANTDVVARLRDHGMLAVPAGENVVRLLPPLNIGDEHVEEALAVLDRVAQEVGA